jgi:hypothetical protein
MLLTLEKVTKIDPLLPTVHCQKFNLRISGCRVPLGFVMYIYGCISIFHGAPGQLRHFFQATEVP